MNRLSNYLESAKLARMECQMAAVYEVKDPARALRHVRKSMEQMLIAMNNVVSIAFKSKPKKASHARI